MKYAFQIISILWLISIMGVSNGNNLSSIHWESRQDAFFFHIETQNPIKFDSVDKTREEAHFLIDILEITKIYENQILNPVDARVKKIVIQSRPWDNIVRFQFYPEGGIHWKIVPSKDTKHLQVEFHAVSRNQNFSSMKSNSPVPSKPPTSTFSSKSQLSSTRNPKEIHTIAGSSKKLIIIDPGHGGFNKGARTQYRIKGKHYWEKDLVFQYAQKLKYLASQSPNLSALMTREKDKYVSLGERVNFAQKHKGDLFISIHLNSSPNPKSKTARGVEIFHWRDTGSDNAAIHYLEKLENDQLLPKLPKSQDAELKDILTSMLKDALEEEKSRSANLCNVMWKVLSQNSYFKYHHRTPVVKSARFVVLANYAMPSILVEVGFLSNKEEAPYLISNSFQWTTAKLLYNGIQAFFEREDPNFKAHYIK